MSKIIPVIVIGIIISSTIGVSTSNEGKNWNTPTTPTNSFIAFIFGKITNYTKNEDNISFHAEKIHVIGFIPFISKTYTSYWKIAISTKYLGIITEHRTCVICLLQTITPIIPHINFVKSYHALIVAAADSNNILWSNLDISGSCNTSNLGTYVEAGEQITDCSGTINITFIPTNTLLGT